MKKINWKKCVIIGVISGILSFLLQEFLHMDAVMAVVLSLLLVTCGEEILYYKKNNKKTEDGEM